MFDLFEGLKILSILFGSVFAAFGLVAEFKDPVSRKVTRSGKVALVGIIASLLVSLALVRFEAARARDLARQAEAEAESTTQQLREVLEVARETVTKQDATLRKSEEMNTGVGIVLGSQQDEVDRLREMANSLKMSLDQQGSLISQTSSVLQQTQRALQPLDDPAISFRFDIPISHPLLAPYVARISQALPKENLGMCFLGGIPNLLPRLDLIEVEAAAWEIMLNSKYLELFVFAKTPYASDARGSDLLLTASISAAELGDLPRSTTWIYEARREGEPCFSFLVDDLLAEVAVQAESMASLLDWRGATVIVTISTEYPDAWQEITALSVLTPRGLRLSVGAMSRCEDLCTPFRAAFATVVPDTSRWWPSPPAWHVID